MADKGGLPDPELGLVCPTCSAPVDEDCRGFGYCQARSDAAAKALVELPPPYVGLYRGTLTEHDHGEAFDILFLDPDEDYEPLAKRIEDDIDAYGRYLTVRYWTASEPRSDDAMIEGALRELLGDSEGTGYTAHYSEYTGYLWTDEEVKVGGHDLLAELRSHLGEYCLLEITYQQEPKP